MIGVVTGGRDYQPTPADLAALDAAIALYGCTRIRCGMAAGVDTAVYWHYFTGELGCYPESWAADWDRFGNRAGILRNTAMLRGDCDIAKPIHPDEQAERSPGTASVLFAFPGGTGTAHCVAAAHALRIEVVRIIPSSPTKP